MQRGSMTTRRKSTTSRNFVQLPLLGNAVIYARVGTPQELQPDPVETLLLYAQELGYADEQITVYTDTAEQTAAPLNTRQGYLLLLQVIRAGKVQILYLYAEHYILSGADEQQVNTFIQLCIEKTIVIVTPHA